MLLLLSILSCLFPALSSPNSNNRHRQSSINPTIFIAWKVSCTVKLGLFSDNGKNFLFNRKRTVWQHLLLVVVNPEKGKASLQCVKSSLKKEPFFCNNFCVEKEIMGFNCSQDALGLTLGKKLPNSNNFTAQVQMADGFCGFFAICCFTRGTISG